MAIVSTLPQMGGEPTFYEIPDADLEKYQALEIKAVGEDENPPEGAEKAEQIEAPGAAQPEAEVQAYRRRHLARCFVYNRYTGYIYYWYWCYV